MSGTNGTNATQPAGGEAGELVAPPWWMVEGELFDDQKGTVTLLVLLMLWAALTLVGTVMCLPAPSLSTAASSNSATSLSHPPHSHHSAHLEASDTSSSRTRCSRHLPLCPHAEWPLRPPIAPCHLTAKRCPSA